MRSWWSEAQCLDGHFWHHTVVVALTYIKLPLTELT